MSSSRQHLAVEVETLPPEGEAFTLILDDAGLRRQWNADYELANWRFDHVGARIRLTPSLGGIDLAATLSIHCHAPCVRCLDAIELTLEDRVELRFERSENAREVRLSEGSLDILDFNGVTIDLTAWLAEQVTLSIPDLPRCESHAGRPCAGPALSALAEQKPDPRWAALSSLKRTREP